jgi:uncharacterized membrane protein
MKPARRPRLVPDLPRTRSARRPLWALATVATGLVLGLAVLPPFVPEGLRAALDVAFSPVCHGLDARSFHVHGDAFAVCHRCTGIFAGLFVGTLLWPLVRRFEERLTRHAGLLLGLSLLPAAVDWGLGVAGVWANTPASRTLSGVLFGTVAGVYLARGFARMGATADPEAVRMLDLSHPSQRLG